MRTLECCPACQSEHLIASPIMTNVTEADVARFSEGVVADSVFAVCGHCDLLFARRRQDESDAEAYYSAFQVLEQRDYATYPPPELFLESQRRFSDWLLAQLTDHGVVRQGSSVLNVRCENGIHLANLRDRHGVKELYGLDHFETNLRYAREDLGLENVALFHPAKPTVPFQKSEFDLVLANHQITHALEPLKLLRQFRDWLTPSGVLVLYNENDHLRLLRRRRIFKEGVGNYHKQLLTSHSLHNLCRRAGLEWHHYTHRGEAIKWAAPRDCMLVMARRSESVSSEALPAVKGSPTLRAIAVGRSMHRMYRVGKYVEGIFNRPAA